MNYIIFEDSKASNLNPFTLNHASFEIRCGIYSNIERVYNLLSSRDKLYLIVRPVIEDIIRERFPQLVINPKIIPAGLMLNGATVWDRNSIDNLEIDKSYSSKGSLIAINRSISTDFDEFYAFLDNSIQVTLDISVVHINYIWDLIFNLPNILKNDLDKKTSLESLTCINQIDGNDNDLLLNCHPSVVANNKSNIFIGENIEICAGVILDANAGPILIDKFTKIDIGALIQGPTCIGKNSIVNPGAKLRGNISIGPVCKIGGELEDVIIQGYTNKQHDGYLGHSFLGEWINLGANTNNSDLKNNYSKIRINISKDLEINTLQQFLGVCIGDYTRTGISTMLNSGTFIGLGANVFGSGFQPKYIESFQWGREEKTDFDKFIQTCMKMKERRKKSLSDVEIKLLKYIYELNE